LVDNVKADSTCLQLISY